MAIQRPALKANEPIVEMKGSTELPAGAPRLPFLIFMRGLRADLDSAPAGFQPVVIEGRTSAIGTTAIPTDEPLSKGLYRVSWAAKVVTVAAVSSDFQVTISWTWKGATQQKVGALMNGNLTTTYEANSVPLMYVDAASPITYAVSYNSNPANAMAFDVFLTLERLAAL